MTLPSLRPLPTPFPWPSAPRLDRATIRARAELVSRAAAALDWTRVGGALAELLGDDVQFMAAGIECRLVSAAPFAGSDCLALRFQVHGLRLWVGPEPELWRCAVARLLDQEFQLGWADSAIDAALRGYKEINLRAFHLLSRGGVLVTCSCSFHVDDAAFERIVLQAASDAKRSVQVIERRGAARDHPTLLGVPETRYLKCLILRAL